MESFLIPSEAGGEWGGEGDDTAAAAAAAWLSWKLVDSGSESCQSSNIWRASLKDFWCKQSNILYEVY